MNPQALTEEGRASAKAVEHSQPAGSGTANSQPREILKSGTHLGAQPSQNFGILLGSTVKVPCLHSPPSVRHVSYKSIILFC